METYLWDFSFKELFLADNGLQTWLEAKMEEQEVIKALGRYYEKMAENSRNQIQEIDNRNFSTILPSLMHADMVLQLCLIHSLSIFECAIKKGEIIQVIEQESLPFFTEYRSFGRHYDFEKYSLMSQITLA